MNQITALFCLPFLYCQASLVFPQVALTSGALLYSGTAHIILDILWCKRTARCLWKCTQNPEKRLWVLSQPPLFTLHAYVIINEVDSNVAVQGLALRDSREHPQINNELKILHFWSEVVLIF